MKKLNEIKFNIWSIVFFIMILPSLLPTYLWRFQYISLICRIIRYMSLFLMLYILILKIILKREKPSLVLILILIAIISLGISTKLSSTGEMSKYISSAIVILCTILVFEWGIKKRAQLFIKSLLFMLECWIVINLFTIILFPQGLYKAGSYSSNYFLGYDNTHIRIHILALTISYIYSFSINKKLSFRTIALYVISLLSNFTVFSATGIIAILLWGICIFFITINDKKGICKKLDIFNIKSSLIGGIIGSFILVGISSNSTFSYIVENIFGKDMTLSGRTYIWINSIEAINKSLVWGYGYEQDNAISMRLVKQIGFGTSPHNFYLELLYNGGIILLIIVILIYLLMSKKLSEYKNLSMVKGVALSLLVISIMGIVEPQFNINLIILWVITYNLDTIIKNSDKFNTINSDMMQKNKKYKFILK